MKLSELIRELVSILACNEDIPVNISCLKQKECPSDQSYLMAEPTVITVEDYGDHKEVSIRDWPY